MTNPEDNPDFSPDSLHESDEIDPNMQVLPPERTIRMGVGLKTVALLSLVAALAGAIGGALLSEAIRQSKPTSDIDTIRSEMGVLSQDRENLTNSLSKTQADVKAIETRRLQWLSAVEARLKTLEKPRAKANVAAPQEVKELEARLKKLESRPVAADGSIDNAADFENRIKDLEQQASPYEIDDIMDRLDRLEVKSVTVPAIVAIPAEPLVETVVIPALPKAEILGALEKSDPIEGNWLNRTLRKHVTVREAGTDSPQDILTKVEDRVAAGDYKAALDLFDTLPSRARAAGADWRAAIEADLEAQK